MNSGSERVALTEDVPAENGSTNRQTPDTHPLSPRTYKRRWLILAIFVVYSMSSANQWIHLNIISNIIMGYYNESIPGTDPFQKQVAIDWLSMLYMLAYIPLIFPATWLLDKKGLKIVAIFGSFLNCLGAWIKCGAVAPDRFGVLMFAQTICAIAQIFILGIPARLASVWFGPSEVSTATAIGVFGNQVGCAVGFLIPPAVIPASDDPDVVGHHLSIMFYVTAGITTAIMILIILVFESQPPHPPSVAQLAARRNDEENYLASLKRLFRNRGFLLLTVSYGINTGTYYAIGTLLNPVILAFMPGEEVNVGRIGLTIVLSGVLGSIICGIWLDRTKTYKKTTVIIYFLSLLGMVAFAGMLYVGEITVMFVVGGVLGFFMTGYLPVGFEFAAEITYPESEGTSSGLLNASAQVFGIIFTLGMTSFMQNVSILAGNILLTSALLIGAILTALIKSDLRRQRAGKLYLTDLDGDVTEQTTSETAAQA